MSFVQGGQNNAISIAAGGSLSVTLGSPVASGQTICVFVSLATNPVSPTISDDKGNSYGSAINKITGTGAAAFDFLSFAITNVTNGPQTITVNPDPTLGGNYIAFVVMVMTATGPLAAHGINQQPSLSAGTNAVTSGSVTVPSSPAGTYTLVAACCNGGNGSATAGTGFTLRVSSAGSGNDFAFAEDGTAAAGANVAGTFTSSIADDWATALLVFAPVTAVTLVAAIAAGAVGSFSFGRNVVATAATGAALPFAALGRTLLGTSATGAVGALLPSPSETLTGVAVSGAAAGLSPSPSKTLVGVAVSGAVGALLPSLSETFTGVMVSGAAAGLSPSLSETFTGAVASGAAAALLPSPSKTLVGVAVSGAVAPLSVEVDIALAPVAATSGVGVLSFAGQQLVLLSATATLAHAQAFSTQIMDAMTGSAAIAGASPFMVSGLVLPSAAAFGQAEMFGGPLGLSAVAVAGVAEPFQIHFGDVPFLGADWYIVPGYAVAGPNVPQLSYLPRVEETLSLKTIPVSFDFTNGMTIYGGEYVIDASIEIKQTSGQLAPLLPIGPPILTVGWTGDTTAKVVQQFSRAGIPQGNQYLIKCTAITTYNNRRITMQVTMAMVEGPLG